MQPHEEGGKIAKGANKNTKPPPKVSPTTQRRINNKFPTMPENNTGDKITKGEDESESDSGSSVQVIGEEIGNHDKKEEQSSDEERAETHGSEESSEEAEAEALDTQSDTEQSATREPDNEKAEFRRSGFEVEPIAFAETEEGKVNWKKATEDGDTVSYAGEVKEIRHEDSAEPTTTKKTYRQQRQPLHPLLHAKENKYKMFKRSKADKQAEKAEKTTGKSREAEA